MTRGNGSCSSPAAISPQEATRLLGQPDALPGVREAEQEMLAAATSLSSVHWHEVVASAVLDLNVLSYGLAAPVAAWSPHWRYVWPRDTAHVCRALAFLGREEEVLRCLRFLSRIQREDGHFEARYTLSGRLPDDRVRQSDGIGWFLWAIRESCRALPERRARILAQVRQAASTGLTALYADLDATTDGLPGASPDYWEMPERRTTLGIAAVTLAGLQATADLGAELCPEAVTAQEYADRLAWAIRVAFGTKGFQRYAAGGGHDGALTFLLPPYVSGFESEAGSVLDRAWQAMARPAGGVAPGAGWKDNFITWTPQTALFAQAHAELGESERAEEIVDWLARHRTGAGSLPEKVLADGSPAAVAPLAWTCALVTSTIFRLAD